MIHARQTNHAESYFVLFRLTPGDRFLLKP